MYESKTPLSQPRILVTENFINSNELKLRSQKEVSDHISDVVESDYFGFSTEVLIDYLDFNEAKKHLTDEYVKQIESGEKVYGRATITTIEECAQDFLDYMNFAWGKAEAERGISASRSISKLSAWLWLMNREDLVNVIEDDNLFNPYGSPVLISVCQKMNIDVPKSLIEFSKVKC